MLIVYFLSLAHDFFKKISLLSNRSTLFHLFLIITPVIFGFMIVTYSGVNVLYMDDWLLPNFIDDVLTNGISLDALRAKHVVHLMFFPRLIFLASGLLSHLNNKVNMYISYLLEIIVYITILCYLKRLIPESSERGNKQKLFLQLLLGFCCFNLVVENIFLMGVLVHLAVVSCFTVLSFYFFYLHRIDKKNIYLVVSILCGIISSFSSLQGLFVFPSILCLLILLSISNKEKGLFHYIIILLFIALTILIYDFHFPPDFSLPHTGKNIIAHIVFFFASLGSSLSFHVAGIFEAIIFLIVGLMIFVVTILICIYLIRHKRLQENVFPALLVIFGFIFCIVLTIDHGQESAWVALASHYTIFTMFIIIGLIMIIYTEFIKDGRSGRIKQIAVNGLKLIAFIVLLQNTDVLKLKYIRDDKLELQHIIRTYEDRDLIELQKSGPWDDLESAYNQIHIIERRHWNVFR